MTNHITTEHCVAAKKKNGRFVDLEPPAGLDVAMAEFQTSILNPTERDVVISNMIVGIFIVCLHSLNPFWIENELRHKLL